MATTCIDQQYVFKGAKRMSQIKFNATLTPELELVVARVLALRGITAKTGMRTTRSQNDILGALSDTDLSLVALALAAVETR